MEVKGELEEKIWRHIFALSALCGQLATFEDDELKKWFAIDAKETRKKLIELNDNFMNDLGWK